MANKHIKRCSNCSLLYKFKSKLQWGITSHKSEWPSSKSLQAINAGEGVGKSEPTCTVAAAAAAAKSLQSCPTLCVPMDYSLPGSCVHGIFRARVLEWGAIAFSGNCCIPSNNIMDFFSQLHAGTSRLPSASKGIPSMQPYSSLFEDAFMSS